MVDRWSKNYWHWTADFLTRIESIEAWSGDSGQPVKFLVDGDPKPWQLDSLAALGIGRDRLVYWKVGSLKVERLVVPSVRRARAGDYHGIESPEALGWVARRVRTANTPDVRGTERLFVDRPQATARAIVNRDALQPLLDEYGFKVIDPSSMSFAQQVRAFAGANVVPGAHGAGLTNLIYGSDLKVIELFGPYFPRCYSVTSRSLGFQHAYLACRAPARDARGWDADLIIDLKKLRDLLDMLSVHPKSL